MSKLGAAELGGCWSSKCCGCVPGCAYACFPCGDDCMCINTCPGPNYVACRVDDDTFIARGKNGGSICIIKVVDATKMYANPCCCTTETEEGACLIWSRAAKGAPDNAEIER